VTATSPEWPLPGDPDASVGARHHRVPRFYLERFANERMQITTVDRRTRARRTAAIKETAAEKDFYTAINTEGAKDGKSEQLLSHVEGNAARAIKNILNPVFPLFPPQPQDRADLCLFLAFQKVRGKLTRKRIEMLGDLWAHLQIPTGMTTGRHGHGFRPTSRRPRRNRSRRSWNSAPAWRTSSSYPTRTRT
jgi:Protein of unknown function (DUF4238)